MAFAARSPLKAPYHRKYWVFIVNPNNANEPVTPLNEIPYHHRANTVSTVIQEFLQNTTIPGLNQLNGNSSLYLKLLWTFVFFTGIGMAVFQSEKLISEYRRYAVLQRTTHDVKKEIHFPSVTVCLNIPVRWVNYSTEPGYSLHQHVVDRFNLLNDTKTEDLADDFSAREKILLEELSKLSKTEMKDLNYEIERFTLSCNWRDRDCMSELLHFHNLYYGSCFTFNPGFDNTSIKASSEDLNIVLRYDFKDRFPYDRRDEGVVVMIHPPGTMPHFDRRKLYPLYPGRWINIGVKQTIIERLPKPYSSECVDSHSKRHQERILGYSPQTPYLYTLDSCISSCNQNLSLKLCDCVNAFFPLPANHRHVICPFHGCTKLNDEDGGIACACKQPCRDISYDYFIITDDRWLKQATWNEWVKNLMEKGNDSTYDISRVSGFQVFVTSMQVETIIEEPVIQWADFLGSIGGNLSLWVGISVISLVEVAEFVRKLIFEIVRTCLNK